MARDLIPPPSPAGRPAPDPEPHEPAVAEEAAPGTAAPAARPGPSPFRTRFGFVTGMLAGCAVAAGVLFVVLRGDDSKRAGGGGGGRAGADDGLAANWSPWQPRATDAVIGAQEIAKKIGGTYKDEKAKTLAKVKGGRIAIGTFPIPLALPSGTDDRYAVQPGLGVQYTLAGYGKDGRLLGTKPSEQRRRLLRREALELSLYTFRYLDDATMVVALLPPAPRAEQVHPTKKGRKAAAKKPGAFQPQALFYRRGELRKELEKPLQSTLATKAPRLDKVSRAEAKRIDRLTLKHLYTYVHHQEQDGSFYLLLDRPS